MTRLMGWFLMLVAVGVLGCAGCKRQGQIPEKPNDPASSEPQARSDPPENQHAAPWFVESSRQRGLDFVHQSGHTKDRFRMPESVCGGGALFDMDGDGYLDAYLIQSGNFDDPREQQPGNRLYRNRGDGTFEDVTEGSGADDRGYGIGVACGDYDNDGRVDLYITNVGPNTLLHNNGEGKFVDVTEFAGVGHGGHGASTAFVDYDNDGDLDLMVVNYLNWSPGSERLCYNSVGSLDYCHPTTYESPSADLLYRNNGDGTFTNVSEASGLNAVLGTGLGVLCGDFNNDGWIDIFVANDAMDDRLWMNQGDGSFVEQALLAGCAVDEQGVAKAGMGVTAADVDDDGDLDLLVCNLHNESDSFFRNEGEYFVDGTAAAGLATFSRPYTRFGMGWVDFDNDGYLDLYQANGRIDWQEDAYVGDIYAEPNVLFRGKRGGEFEAVTPLGGTETLLIATSRGAAFGDVDNDGAIDVLVVNRDGPAHLLSNVGGTGGNWILFAVREEHGRDAYGAIVTMQLAARTITRDVRAAYSYCSSSDPRVHVGLGRDDRVTAVTVRWPDGEIEVFGDFEANQVVTLSRGAGPS